MTKHEDPAPQDAAAQSVSDSERLLFGGELAYDVGWDQHEGAWLKLGLWTMAKALPSMAATGLKLAHLADARALRVVLGAEVGRGITQAVGLVAVNSVLGHILAGGTTNDRLARAVPALVVVALTALLGSLLRSRRRRRPVSWSRRCSESQRSATWGWSTRSSSRRSRTTNSTASWMPPATAPTPPAG